METLRNASLQQLVENLKSQNVKKRDLIVSSDSIKMEKGNLIVKDVPANNNDLKSLLNSAGIKSADDDSNTDYFLFPWESFHDQISGKLDIPRGYYNRLREEENIPALDYNVNFWLNKSDKNYLLRTFDNRNGTGEARAFLSDRYSIIDNYDILIAALDAIKDHKNIQIEVCDLTEKKMYVRFYDPTIEIKAPEILKRYRNPKDDSGNDSIISGFVISNSEIGYGSYSISPRAIVLACRNGLTRKEEQLKKIHLGSRLEVGSIEWSQQTIQKNLSLIKSQTTDAVKTYISREYWERQIKWIDEVGNKKLEKPVDCTKNVCKHLGLNDQKMDEVVNYFLNGREFTRFGVSQALTFFAHETDDADEQFAIESEALEILPVMNQFDKEFKK